MRRIITFIIVILTMATMNAQTLTERQKGLAACACLMAQGDLERLEPAVKAALDNGVTINELKEAFSQLYAYTGFPRSSGSASSTSISAIEYQPCARPQQCCDSPVSLLAQNALRVSS